MNQRTSTITEIGIFSIGIGLLLALAAILILSSISPSAPSFLGMPRGRAIGGTLALVAAGNGLAGLAVLVTRSRLAIVASMVAALTIGIYYLALLTLSGGGVRFNLMTILAVAIPLLVFMRGKQALYET